jgi:hypothetical protein
MNEHTSLRILVRALLREGLRDFQPSDDPEFAEWIENSRHLSGYNYRHTQDILRNKVLKVDEDGEIWELSRGYLPPTGLHWNRDIKNWEPGYPYYARIGKPFPSNTGSSEPIPALEPVDPSDLETGDLGKYAFSPQRRKGRLEVPHEPNTNMEQHLYDAIVKLTTGNDPISPELFKVIDRLMKSGKYDDVFENLAPSTPIYRGMRIDGIQLTKLLTGKGVDADAVLLKARKGKSFSVNGIPWGRPNGTASWTLSRGRATKFAITPAGKHSGGYPILVETTIASVEKYMSYSSLYKTNVHMGGFSDEQEVAVFGVVHDTKTTIMDPNLD